jgi:hypothetical protein
MLSNSAVNETKNTENPDQKDTKVMAKSALVGSKVKLEYRPKIGQHFPVTLTRQHWGDEPKVTLDDSVDFAFLHDITLVGQKFDSYQAIEYAESKILAQDLQTLSSDNFIQIIKELHAKCARSLQLTQPDCEFKAGEFTSSVTTVVRNGFDGRIPQGFKKNAKILRLRYGANEEKAYNRFCNSMISLLGDKLTSSYDLIMNNGLDKKDEEG